MTAFFNRFRWLAVLAGLIVLAYAIPYILLPSVERLYGAFLFWTVFGIAAVSLIILRTARWKV